jgi:TonB family protein
MKRHLAFALAAVLLTSAVRADEEPPKEAGKDVPSPQRVKVVMPKYPAGALARGERALVILDVVVGEDGKVAEVKVLHGTPIFAAAAMDAVKQWRYESSKVAGRPVRVRLTVPVSFATKLPEVLREPGIPELRLGTSPALPPEGSPGGSAIAHVEIDADGKVTGSSVIQGVSPWAEALLEAVRTWRFTDTENGKAVQFDVHADFKGGSTSRKVDLALTDPRPLDDVRVVDAGAAPRNMPTEVAAPGIPTEVPAPGIPTRGPGPGPGLPPGATPPPPSLPATPERPTVEARPTLPEPRPTSAATGTPPAPPRATRAPVEVVGPAPGPAAIAAAPAPNAPPENGLSTILDVQLVGTGIPDLVRGRRPVAPPTVRLSGVYGDVTVRFSIDSGGVTAITGVEGPDALKEAADSVVRSWCFRRTAAHRVYATAQIHYAGEGTSAKVTASSDQ